MHLDGEHYSDDRERQTLDKCEAIIEKMRELRSAMAEFGPLTRQEDKDFPHWLDLIEFRYSDIARHCRKNLR